MIKTTQSDHIKRGLLFFRSQGKIRQNIDAHGFKIQGEGGSSDFCQNPCRGGGGRGGGGQGLQEKLPGGGPPMCFIAFLLTSLLKFAWVGSTKIQKQISQKPEKNTF